MIEFLIKLLLVARSKLKSRARLEAENIVLRQQVIVLKPQGSVAGAASEAPLWPEAPRAKMSSKDLRGSGN